MSDPVYNSTRRPGRPRTQRTQVAGGLTLTLWHQSRSRAIRQVESPVVSIRAAVTG